MNAPARLVRDRIGRLDHPIQTRARPDWVIEAARPPFCITHKAGHMLVTDRLNEEFREA